jgi:biopolymer transport protein ExbD
MGIPRVLVSRQSIMLEGDASSTIALPPPERWALGVDGSYKGTGPNDLYLVPLAAALERIRQAKGAPLAVAFDASIPYRIVVEVLFTAGQADYGQYHLVTRTAAGLGAILTVPPRVGSARPSVRTLNLAVFVTSLGMAVKTSGGNVAPGCAGAGPGIALPRSPTGLDLAGLSACAALVRAQDSSFATETTAVVVANPGVPFGEVVAVMDALRVEPSGRVGFPDIRFGVAR